MPWQLFVLVAIAIIVVMSFDVKIRDLDARLKKLENPNETKEI